MKIQKLEIKNIRGIPELVIEPRGKSFAVYGSNGSGKSALIDALDFLLTGNINRLSGEGTEGISLKAHGPHINKIKQLEDVEVIADITLPGVKEVITISRIMTQPNTLVYDEKFKENLSPVLELLTRGQYVFTRREILKLITSRAKTRADEITRILKLDEVEEIRSVSVNISNESKKDLRTAEQNLNASRNSILQITGLTTYKEDEVLMFVNDQRILLGVSKINKLSSELIKSGIQLIKKNEKSIDYNALGERTKELLELIKQENFGEVRNAIETLDGILFAIKADAEAVWNTKRYSFTENGLNLIRDTEECPLCDIRWEEGELKKYLQGRLDNEKDRQNKINTNCAILISISSNINLKITQIQQLILPVLISKEVLNNLSIQQYLADLMKWSKELVRLSHSLNKPLEIYYEVGYVQDEVKRLFTPPNIEKTLTDLTDEIKVFFPEATPEQGAWEKLIRIEERLKALEESQISYINSVAFNEHADTFEKVFLESRDQVLNTLYSSVKDRFVSLYKELHNPDEDHFGATFEPQKAGLQFQVDFYGKGYNPPHALHSEGHQDSMGICLFLALSEHLNSGLIDILILDDVVMSVDSGHRKAFCSVLKNNFPNRQFIITTHDTTWANQLRSEGVIQTKQMLMFYNWNVDTGPIINYEVDMWVRIGKDIENDNIPEAAAKLRRGLEEFSRYMCHNLRAPVPYTLGDGGTIGDFMPAAIGQYMRFIRQAKKSAQTWHQQNVIESLTIIESTAKQIIQRTKVEEWAINAAVHYNEWAKFSKNDFGPVFEAFRDLCNVLFICPNPECGSVIKAVYEGSPTAVGMRCSCGSINWNLKDKT